MEEIKVFPSEVLGSATEMLELSPNMCSSRTWWWLQERTLPSQLPRAGCFPAEMCLLLLPPPFFLWSSCWCVAGGCWKGWGHASLRVSEAEPLIPSTSKSRGGEHHLPEQRGQAGDGISSSCDHLCRSVSCAGHDAGVRISPTLKMNTCPARCCVPRQGGLTSAFCCWAAAACRAVVVLSQAELSHTELFFCLLVATREMRDPGEPLACPSGLLPGALLGFVTHLICLTQDSLSWRESSPTLLGCAGNAGGEQPPV